MVRRARRDDLTLSEKAALITKLLAVAERTSVRIEEGWGLSSSSKKPTLTIYRAARLLQEHYMFAGKLKRKGKEFEVPSQENRTQILRSQSWPVFKHLP